MKKYYLFIFSMLLCSIEILGQCEDRYESPIFENIIVDTLQYSDVTGFKMDVYTAADDDFTGLKPLIILAHGGSFYAGSKANPTMVRLGNEFAKRGYVVASIQYTLTSSLNLVDSLIMVETVMQAIGDGKAAIRWFRKDAEENGNQFNIDAEQIFVGGNSAGAVLMNNLAYIDEEDDLPAYMDSIIVANGGLEGNAGNFGYSTEVNGVVNLAGAIYRKWVISNNTKPPIFSAHGDIDDVVPFDCNSIFWGNLGNLLMEMCGSSIIHEVANDIGLQSELVVLEGEGHTPWSFEDGKMSTIVERSSNFVYNLLNCNITSAEELFSVESLNAYPNPSNNQINIDFKGFGTLFEIQVVDMLGKLVYEDISESSFYSLFRGDFKSGIYFLTAKNEKYTLKTKFIFK